MKRILAIILIAGLGILVYSNAFYASFQLDDNVFIINNFALRDIHDLLKIWDYYPGRFVTFLSLAWNYHFYHLNVPGYHLWNVAVHLGCAVLVSWLVLLTLSTPAMRGDTLTRHAHLAALLTGLVFVAHPLQTEAVTYIWQRAASLAAFFYLASLCFYVKSRLQEGNAASGRGPFFYTCSLIAAVMAMFTKENTITLPLMVLLYESSFLSPGRKITVRRCYFFLVFLLIIPLTMFLTQSVNFYEMHRASEGPPGILPIHYLLTQFRVEVTYLRLAFLPLHQNLDYDYPVSHSLFEFPTLASFLFLLIVLFTAKYLFTNYRLVSFSIFWFFLTLLPESSLVPMKDVIFEHRLYLPLAGYSMFLVSSVYYLLGNNAGKTMVMVLMVIMGYSVLTYHRNYVWQNELTLWNDTVAKSPSKVRPYNNRGKAYFVQGDLVRAMADFNKAIALDPRFANAYDNLGLIYARQGRFGQAISNYDRSIQLKPGAKAYINRSSAFESVGDLTAAISDCRKAIGLDPQLAGAYYNLGHFYAKQGHLEEALSDYSQAIAIDPDYAEAYNSRGNTYRRLGRWAQALTDFNKALDINPAFAAAYYNRGLLYEDQRASAKR